MEPVFGSLWPVMTRLQGVIGLRMQGCPLLESLLSVPVDVSW